MPARRTVAVLGASLALLTAAAPADAARTVERGDRGKAVKVLQRKLGIHADGIFGPGTAHAVKRFQKSHGLTPDGIVGPATWSALQRRAAHRAHARARQHRRAASSSTSTRSRGGAVKALQRRLGIPADGVFGPQTQAAVKRFQRSHGLVVDGVVGPATWAALGVRGAHPVLKRGRLGGARHHRGGLPRAVRRAIRAANRIDQLPYRYGGGHGSFTDTGYDCSGSVSYVLHAAGKLRSPLDSSALMSYGRTGPGRYITIYSNPGHVYMTINGRRFDTSGSAAGRWQPDQRSSAGYVVRHPPGL
ncbi:MAG TPA: peptidoglycan-binding protein [Capillimicrobium sp.]|nr:peptidoglycan-binding protein [Capillimicrobium sp.]